MERRRDRENAGDVGNRSSGKETGSDDDGFKMVASNVLVLYVNGKRVFLKYVKQKHLPSPFGRDASWKSNVAAGKTGFVFLFPHPSCWLRKKKEECVKFGIS